MSDRPWAGRRLHLIGLGGAGMSAYARALHGLGATVSGSDRADSPFLAALEREGIATVHVGHDPAHLPEGAIVVPSSAIPPENAELQAARERGLTVLSRADLLGELSALKRTIAVAGAHGKTTTASMLVYVLRAGGLDPCFLVGGTVGDTATNGYWSDSPWLVVEADESDRSLLSLHVEIAVLTNVELDHHNEYGSEQELREVFRTFLSGAREAVVWDRPALRELRDGPVVAFDAPDPELVPDGSRLAWRGHEVHVGVPGAMNARNAVAALEAGRLAGVPDEQAAGALARFPGAGRRMQRLGTGPGGALLYDDYAHNPTKVAAAVAAARTLEPERLVVVFQPHLYSRTRVGAERFGEALRGADEIAVLDVYPARERAEAHPGVSGLLVATAAAADGRRVLWLPTFEVAEPVLEHELRAGDLAVFMGAGDIDVLARRLVRG
ncbi:MAG TPA: Mur ligase domain-containing protein [Solirubrobacteraceae bacterium]|nr:Mur ligase domain-containing protein [Solirubrobacteraceae bacterium]